MTKKLWTITIFILLISLLFVTTACRNDDTDPQDNDIPSEIKLPDLPNDTQPMSPGIVYANNPIGEPDWVVIDPSDPTQGTFVAAYDASQYGVSPDNVDNTTAIQALIDKIHSLGGGALYIPRGMYQVDGPLIIERGVILRGDWTEPVKGEPFDIVNNTLLKTDHGRGQNNLYQGFINLTSESAVVNISIWYPEQNPDNIVPYSPAIYLGIPLKSNFTNLRNVTLINPYIGVQYLYSYGGVCPTINGVYGTPLRLGVDIDAVYDIGRIERLYFSPDYWSASGLPGAPEKGSDFERYIYKEGIGVRMGRNDWSYTCFLDIEGYNIGFYAAITRNAESLATDSLYGPNGHNYNFIFTKCKTGIYVESNKPEGIMFTNINIDDCETGFHIGEKNNNPVHLYDAKINTTNNAIFMQSGELLINQSHIYKGAVNVSAGIINATNTTFINPAPQIIFGEYAMGILVGNNFKEPYMIEDNSIHNHIIEHTVDKTLLGEQIPDFPGGRPVVKLPKKQDLYIVSDAPYNAIFQEFYAFSETTNIPDSTNIIQDALDDAGRNGGGIVFLPPGKYRVNGNLTIPTGVELRGAGGEISSVSPGSGSVLEVYGGRDEIDDGNPFIIMKEGSGLRGIVINYPNQVLINNFDTDIAAYPYTIQGQGKDIYIMNVKLRAAWNGLDLSTFRCDNAFVDYLSGFVFMNLIKIGATGRDIDIRNMQFNPYAYDAGAEKEHGEWPNSRYILHGDVFIREELHKSSEFMIIGDCENLLLYNNFSIEHFIGTRFINQTSGGPQNVLSLGHGTDVSVYPLFFDSGLTGKYDFINTQLVSIGSYIYSVSDSNFRSNFFNANYWGYPETAFVFNEYTGTIEMQTVGTGYGSGREHFIELHGSDLFLINSRFKNNDNVKINFMESISSLSVISSIFFNFNNLQLSFAEQNVGNYIGMQFFVHKVIDDPMEWDSSETEARPDGDLLVYNVTFNNVTSGIAYTFDRIATLNYIVVAGDVLEYDVRISHNISGLGGVDGYIGGNTIRDNPLNIDQNENNAHPGGSLVSDAFSNWFRRKINISNEKTIGKRLTEIQLTTHPGVIQEFSGITVTVWYDNIKITNNGEVKLVIFESADDIDLSKVRSYINRFATAKVSIVNIGDS